MPETDAQQQSSNARQGAALSRACSSPTSPPRGPVSVPAPPSGLGVYFSTFSGATCDQACSWQPHFLHLQLGLRARRHTLDVEEKRPPEVQNLK